MSLEKSKPWSRATAHHGEGCQDRAKANPVSSGRGRNDRSGRCYPHVEPGRKAQQDLRVNVRRELNRWTRYRSSPETVRCVNRIVCGWGHYFHYGQSHQSFARLGDWVRERFRTWRWQKHGCKHSRYGFFANARLHGQYGLWQLPLEVPYRR
jgi:hypothetical protein